MVSQKTLRYFCMLLIVPMTIFSSINAKVSLGNQQRQNRHADWAVIGAGPGGMIALGQLLDEGINPRSIIWIDPEFNVGRLGAYYEKVPSNTMIKTFLAYLDSCISFGFNKCPIPFRLKKFDPEKTCYLTEVIEPLKWVTQELEKQVHSIKGLVSNVQKEKNSWKLSLDDCTIHAKKVILATGSHPKVIDHKNISRIELDDALDPKKLKKLVNADDIVAVFGTSHSGMLVIKTLCQLDVKKIVSFSRSPLCYVTYEGGHYINLNTGLNGTVGYWAREVFEQNPPSNLEKKKIDETTEQELAGCTKVIDAIGYERNAVPGLPAELLEQYDRKTGIIANGLYGIGIAFPKLVLDASGKFENDVGLSKFRNHIQDVMSLWIGQ